MMNRQNDTGEVNPPYIVPSLSLTLLHSERPKLYTILAFLSAIGLKCKGVTPCFPSFS